MSDALAAPLPISTLITVVEKSIGQGNSFGVKFGTQIMEAGDEMNKTPSQTLYYYVKL